MPLRESFQPRSFARRAISVGATVPGGEAWQRAFAATVRSLMLGERGWALIRVTLAGLVRRGRRDGIFADGARGSISAARKSGCTVCAPKLWKKCSGMSPEISIG